MKKRKIMQDLQKIMEQLQIKNELNDDEIKNELSIREEKELEYEIKNKSSLGAIRIMGRQNNGEKYTKILRKKDRKVIAQFRLGTYR